MLLAVSFTAFNFCVELSFHCIFMHTLLQMNGSVFFLLCFIKIQIEQATNNIKKYVQRY